MLLAQEWLYGSTVGSPYDDELRKHIELPAEFNPRTTAEDLEDYAERVVFTDDIPSLLYEMHDNKQLSVEGVISSAKLPFDCFWMEYASAVPDDGEGGRFHYGVLVRVVGKGIDRAIVRMIIVIGTDSLPKQRGFVSCVTHVLEFKQWPPLVVDKYGRRNYAFDIVWAYNQEQLSFKTKDNGFVYDLSDGMLNLCWIVNELVFGIFLITQPRVYDTAEVKHPPKLQRARARRGKKPLLEYRRIALKIGQRGKKYAQPRQHQHRSAELQIRQDTESAEAITHRRYHKVMGHFRHYLKHNPPHTVWIEPFYRGDPSLGVTFTERDVT